MIIFEYHIGSNNLYSWFKSNNGNCNILVHTFFCKLMKPDKEIRRYAKRDIQMKSRSRSHTPIDFDLDSFSFD